MAEIVEPPFETWEEVLRGSPGLLPDLETLRRNQYSGEPGNVADLGFDLLAAAGSFGRLLYQVEWPPRPGERESLATTTEFLAVVAAEALLAIVRFREADATIRPGPERWGALLDSLAEAPATHFYWLGRREPLHAFAYSLWGHLGDSARSSGELIAIGSEATGDRVLRDGADLTALCLTVPAALALGLDASYPGRAGSAPRAD